MQPTSDRARWLALAACLATTFAAGAAGAIASADAAAFYTSLSLPPWAPPASVFGPVWSFLYVLMGLALWLVWRQVQFKRGRTAYALFGAQLLLNALWTWLFFAWKQGALAFVEILALLLAILATMVAFSRIRPLAAWLLVPYLAWVCFASALTWAIWQRNPGVL